MICLVHLSVCRDVRYKVPEFQARGCARFSLVPQLTHRDRADGGLHPNCTASQPKSLSSPFPGANTLFPEIILENTFIDFLEHYLSSCFLFINNVSETVFYFHPQVKEPTQLGPFDSSSRYLRTPESTRDRIYTPKQQLLLDLVIILDFVHLPSLLKTI
jgi:hypothetical protein